MSNIPGEESLVNVLVNLNMVLSLNPNGTSHSSYWNSRLHSVNQLIVLELVHYRDQRSVAVCTLKVVVIDRHSVYTIS